MNDFGRRTPIADSHTYLPLTQEHGGGPTRASICEDGAYFSGKLYVRRDGVVCFLTDEAYAALQESTTLADAPTGLGDR